MDVDKDVEGPFLIGVLLSSVLSGVILSQASTSDTSNRLLILTSQLLIQPFQIMAILQSSQDDFARSSSHTDSRYLKIFVAFLVFLVTFNTSCNFATVYDHFIADPGPTNIFYTSQLFHINFYLAPFISGSVQLYFIYRLYVVAKSNILTICTGSLALICFTSSLVVPALISSDLAMQRRKIQDFILVSRWTSVLVDIVISVAFAVTTFKTTRGEYNSGPGHSILMKLFQMCLRCALFTAGLAFANAISTSFDDNSFKSQGYTAFLLSPAYVSSLLYLLNARKELQELLNQDRPLVLLPVTRSVSLETFGEFSNNSGILVKQESFSSISK